MRVVVVNHHVRIQCRNSHICVIIKPLPGEGGCNLCRGSQHELGPAVHGSHALLPTPTDMSPYNPWVDSNSPGFFNCHICYSEKEIEIKRDRRARWESKSMTSISRSCDFLSSRGRSEHIKEAKLEKGKEIEQAAAKRLPAGRNEGQLSGTC